ncbi:hypothetical protein WG68_16835 [Arsukibacterium ikkense]|uniref:Orphan protein n=1 Tax=Arsukibacterium ikkense TaxID=336831 RepID=A0A0M2V0N8_9GAMM|nr:hypothetical protein [Arsukibacterium ikkense]KKO44131.1 hypothetical protein WG68_16835 [Arsukibacterium ikkense]
MKKKTLFGALACCLLAPFVQAHKFSTAYMDVTVANDQPTLLWKVALHDLAQAKLIAAKNNHQVSWQQVLDSAPVLNRYLAEHLSFTSQQQACQITPAATSEWQLQRLQRDLYLLLPLAVTCPANSDWQLTYRALFQSEASHKLLLSWQVAVSSGNAVLAADSDTYPVY